MLMKWYELSTGSKTDTVVVHLTVGTAGIRIADKTAGNATEIVIAFYFYHHHIGKLGRNSSQVGLLQRK